MRPTAFSPINWAKNVPPMLRADGRVDTTAHHVLLVLATYAKKDGSEARPGLELLADDCYLTPKYVAEALDRIQAAGLISKSACLTGGTVVWRLHLDVVNTGPSVVDQHRERRRLADRERQRRHRERRAGEAASHGAADRDVTASESVTVTAREDVTVTASQAVSHGAAVRESRRATPFVTAPQPLQPQVTPATTASELPIELPIELSPPPPVAITTAHFDAFWAVYPRKVGKKEAQRAWAKAIKDGATADELLAGVRRYAAERAGQDPTYTKHPATWLNKGCWDDEPQRPQLRAAAGGYQPYRSPADQSIYDEDL
jgi:hypothetical protein